MANKKITELTELSAGNIANNDVFAIVDVGGDETKKVTVSSLYDIFDNNVTIDTAKIVYGLDGANTNISALSVNTLPLIGGTVTGTTTFSNTDVMSINAAGNVKIARGLAVGYANKVPGANLDVKGNAYISGATTIAGALTLSSALGVGQGGTGATSLTDGGVLLGSGTSAVTAMGVLGDGEMIVGDGATDPVAESGATLRTSIGVGTGDSPQFTAVNIGSASDTTVSRSGAGDIAVEGNIIYRAGGTDVPVTDGGTGASSLTDGGVLLGSGTSAVTATPVLTDGVMLVGDGSTDPALEGNTTLRTSIGVGTGDTPQFYGANISGNASVVRNIAIGYANDKVPGANLDVNGNAYISTDVRLGQDLVVVRDTTIGRNLTISGNLTAKGNTFIIHANNLVIDDPIITLAANLKSSQSPPNDIGILLNRGSESNVFAGYDDSANSYIIAYTPTSANNSIIDIESYSTTRVGALTASSLTLGTQLPVGQGGTGATSLTDGGVLLGSGTGAITALGVLGDGELIVGDGSTDPVAESGNTLRNSIGVGATASGTVMQIYNANTSGNVKIARNLGIGFANSKVPGANLDVNGNAYISGTTVLGTALSVASGGTGASSLTDGGVLLGSGTGAITALGVLGDGEVIVGDGSTDPVAESGDTLRTSIGVGSTASGTVMQIYGANTSGNSRVARNLAVGYPGSKVPGANLDVNGNAYISGATTVGGALSFGSLASTLGVSSGGTGTTSFTNGGVLFGSGTSAITASPVLTDGVMLVGDGSTDPALEGNTTLRTSIGVGTGDIPNFWGANASGNVSVGRSLAVGYTDGRVPQANLDVNGNVYISGALAVTEIDSASTITLDAETDIVLDAKGGDIYLKDNGTLFATLTRSGGNLTIKNGTSSDTALTFSNDDTDVTGKLTSSVTPSFNYGANATGNISVTRGIAVGYTDGKVPGANLDVKGNAFIGSTLAVTGAVTSGGNTLQTEGDVLAYAIALG